MRRSRVHADLSGVLLDANGDRSKPPSQTGSSPSPHHSSTGSPKSSGSRTGPQGIRGARRIRGGYIHSLVTHTKFAEHYSARTADCSTPAPNRAFRVSTCPDNPVIGARRCPRSRPPRWDHHCRTARRPLEQWSYIPPSMGARQELRQHDDVLPPQSAVLAAVDRQIDSPWNQGE